MKDQEPNINTYRNDCYGEDLNFCIYSLENCTSVCGPIFVCSNVCVANRENHLQIWMNNSIPNASISFLSLLHIFRSSLCRLGTSSWGTTHLYLFKFAYKGEEAITISISINVLQRPLCVRSGETGHSHRKLEWWAFYWGRNTSW